MPRFLSDTIQAHVVYLDENSIYKHLVLKRSMMNKVYRGVWQVVTGRIEKAEIAIEAAIREVREETTLIIQDIWTIPYTANFFNPYTDTISTAPVFGFLAANRKVELSEEHDEYDWLGLNDAIERVVLPTHKKGIKIFNDYILSKADKSLFKYLDEIKI